MTVPDASKVHFGLLDCIREQEGEIGGSDTAYYSKEIALSFQPWWMPFQCPQKIFLM